MIHLALSVLIGAAIACIGAWALITTWIEIADGNRPICPCCGRRL